MLLFWISLEVVSCGKMLTIVHYLFFPMTASKSRLAAVTEIILPGFAPAILTENPKCFCSVTVTVLLRDQRENPSLFV